MVKFKKIAGAERAARRRLLGAAAALALAGPLMAAGPARSASPTVGGVLAENFTWLEPPAPAPETPFSLADGSRLTLASFQDRVVLLNFWATWCAPCVREMPSLDRLQAQLGGEGLEVVAVSEDFAGIDVVAPFFERIGLEHLEVYLDDDGALAKSFGLGGLPTTLLIDRDGRVLGGLEGPAEWDSDEAVALLRHFLERPEQA